MSSELHELRRELRQEIREEVEYQRHRAQMRLFLGAVCAIDLALFTYIVATLASRG